MCGVVVVVVVSIRENNKIGIARVNTYFIEQQRQTSYKRVACNTTTTTTTTTL